MGMGEGAKDGGRKGGAGKEKERHYHVRRERGLSCVASPWSGGSRREGAYDWKVGSRAPPSHIYIYIYE